MNVQISGLSGDAIPKVVRFDPRFVSAKHKVVFASNGLLLISKKNGTRVFFSWAQIESSAAQIEPKMTL